MSLYDRYSVLYNNLYSVAIGLHLNIQLDMFIYEPEDSLKQFFFLGSSEGLQYYTQSGMG